MSRTVTTAQWSSFRKIVDFVSSLDEVLADKANTQVFRSARLYSKLLSKTKIVHKDAILHHIDVFSNFFNRNSEAIVSRDVTKIVSSRVSYSEKVYLDIVEILRSNDIEDDVKDTIWTHLLAIQASIDPTSDAVKALENVLAMSRQNNGNGDNQAPGDSQGLVNAMSGILSNPLFGQLANNMEKNIQSGAIDMKQLMGATQQIFGMLIGGGDQSSGEGGLGSIMSMLASGSIAPSQSAMTGPVASRAQQVEEEINAHVDSELSKNNESTTSLPD